MKLTNADKKLLISWGHPERDLLQLEMALHERHTKYTLDGQPIPRATAIAALGREKFLSGISRSAFHGTAARETADGKIVLFDSSRLIK